MASKGVLMNALFDQFVSFVKELTEMYPNDSDFSLFLTSIKMIRMTNPSLLVNYVNDTTSKYEDQILKKDEKFFLENSFTEYDVDANIFDKLKTYIRSMTDSDKENVWKYIQNITRLAKACRP